MAEAAEPKLLQTTAKSKLQDRTLLDKFTALSDAPEVERIQKTKELLKLLSSRQASHEEDGICDEISYTVSRLVQGLSSNRKFARLGFSVALCQILRSFDSVKVDHVLECVEKKVQGQLSRQSSKSETTNVYLGKIFSYLTLVHSGRLRHESKQTVRQVVQQLLKLGQEKALLQQLCVNGLIQIIAQVKSKVFKKSILPGVEKRFTEGWGNCSPDTLLLLIYSYRHHKKHIEKFLTEHWLEPQLVSEKNFPLIADVVKRSSSMYPLTHIINEELVKCVAEQGLSITNFWTAVVRPLFDSKGFVSKKILGLHFFELSFPHMDTSEKIESILHPDVTNILCHFSQKNEELGNKITSTLKKIVEVVKSTEDGKLQLAIFKSLVRKPGHFHLDRRTKTATLSTIVTCLQPDARAILVKELMKMFSGQPSWLYSKDDNRTECEQWSVKELDMLVTMDQSSSWQLDILQFLFLHSFFNVLKPSAEIEHCNHHTRQLPEISRKCVMDNFFKSVSKCLSHSFQGQSRATVLGNHLDVLFQLMQYGQTLLDSEGIVALNQDLTDSTKTEWTKLMETVKKVNKKRQSDDKIRENHAFELLFLHVGLQLFTDAEGAVESLQDLHVCYKKASQKRKSKAADDGPEWIEVVTELLLSMVFKGTALSRNVAKLVLTALADHITPPAFQLIVNVLKQTTLDSAEDGPLGLEDDEDDADEDGEENADDSNEEDNVSDSSNDDSDDDIDEEEADSGVEEEPDVDIDEELKKKVKSALGDAAVDSNDDSDDEEDERDLSDNEMFKFDDVLAEAFKSMSKGKKNSKEQQKQFKDFKMRVLDLMSVIIKHNPTSGLIKDMIFPLLDMMEGGKTKEELLLLGRKATEMFHSLYKVKKIVPDSSVDREDLLAMVSKLIQYSNKVSSDDMVKEVAKACLLVIRLLLNIEDATGPSPLKTRSKAKMAAVEKKAKSTKDHDYYQAEIMHLIQTSLHKLLHKTEGNKSTLFIHTMIERYPLMFWSLSDELVSTMADLNVKVYQRTQACSLMASMINKRLVTEIGDDSWNEFLGLLQEISSKVLSGLTTETYKAQFMKELLTVYGKIVVISAQDCRKVLGDDGLQKLDSVKTSFSTDIRGLYNKVAKPLGQGSDSSKQGKKKKNKKRKSRSKDENINDNSEGNSSPVKRLKLDDAKAFEKNSCVEKDKRSNKVHSSSPKVGIDLKRVENIDSPAESGKDNNESLIENEKESKKRRKKRRRSKSTDNDNTLRMDTSAIDEVSSVNGNISPGKKVTNVNIDDETVNGDLAQVTNEGDTETPKSNKKHKKRKSSEIGVRNGDGGPLKLAVSQETTKEKESNSLDISQEEKVEPELGDGVVSPRNKKNRKRKSMEMQEAFNSAAENSAAKELDQKEATLHRQTNGVTEDDKKTGSPSREKKKRKNRNSYAPETGQEKYDKFSPRHTRSLKKF